MLYLPYLMHRVQGKGLLFIKRWLRVVLEAAGLPAYLCERNALPPLPDA